MAKTRKTYKGIVVSDKTNKSPVVRLDYQKKHPRFKKYIELSQKVMAHDEKNEAKRGDTVMIAETRPLSRRKRYRLIEVVENAAK